MYMRLIYASDRDRFEISFNKIEHPFFARHFVEQAFSTPFGALDLFDINTYGRQLTHEQILAAVAAGDILLVKDDPFSPLSEDTSDRYSYITGRGWSGGFHRAVEREKPPLPEAEPIVRPQSQEPGFYVVPKSTTGEKLKAALFSVQNPAVISKFEALNPNLGNLNAGSMIVLSDPNNLQCTREEAILMQAAAKTNDALKELSPEEADFMVRHRDEIETFLARGATSIGIGEAIFANNLENVRGLLKEIEALHVRSFQADGHLRSAAFFAERKHLLAQLNTNLTAMTRKSIGFPDHPNLKSALGISSRSLVHRWTVAGGAEQIPGYATHIEGVSRASKYLKYGGWIGTAIGGGASYMKVQDVCTAGDAQACKRVKFKEGGGFAGGLAGGVAVGSVLTASTTGTICLGLSISTAGVGGLACGLVVVAAGSLGAGLLGGEAGEEVGDMIYEYMQ